MTRIDDYKEEFEDAVGGEAYLLALVDVSAGGGLALEAVGALARR